MCQYVDSYGRKFIHAPGDEIIIRNDLRVGQQCAMANTCDHMYAYVDQSHVKYAGKIAIVDHIEDWYYILRINDEIVNIGWTDGMFDDGYGYILFPDAELSKKIWQKLGWTKA